MLHSTNKDLRKINKRRVAGGFHFAGALGMADPDFGLSL